MLIQPEETPKEFMGIDETKGVALEQIQKRLGIS
jgi:hypothetical protein